MLAMSHHESGSRPPCYLLDSLPAELRTRIYEEVFEDTVVDCENGKYDSAGLLLTSQQTYAEARPIFWSKCELRAAGPFLLTDCLNSLVASNLRRLQTVTINLHDPTSPCGSLKSDKAQKNAFYAQMQAFNVQALRGHVSKTTTAQIRFALGRSGEKVEVVVSAEPWHKYTQALEALAPVETVEDSSDDDDSESLCSEEEFGDDDDDHFEPGSSGEEFDNDDDEIHAVSDDEQCEDDQTESLSELLEFAHDQARYFEYDHEDKRKCWRMLWGSCKYHKCGCPKKGEKKQPETDGEWGTSCNGQYKIWKSKKR